MKKYLINGIMTFAIVGFFTGFKMAYDNWKETGWFSV